ncbi:MAG TPA: oxidoreductase [Sphaerochaeta sp.]|nr:MAG: oxidoreductase [Spirochaetes bacterium GWF2_52_7]HCJ95196.1 oxidoreductase [Sphaerochaeta sp.]
MENSRGNVLVTPRSLSKEGHPALSKLEQAGFTVLMPWPGKQPSEEQLLEVVPYCVGYLAGVEPISRNVLEAATRLKIISRNGVGIDNIDLEAAKLHAIAVEGTPGANSQGVAELALGLMFDSLRAIALSNAVLKSGQWTRKLGSEVQGKTLGLVGCGNIGQRFAKMAIGIGMRVIGYDLYRNEEFSKLEGFGYVDLDSVLTDSDVISLHCPPGDAPLLDTRALAMVKHGVVVVNTARDSLVDHGAMFEALERGQVLAYATDAFAKEPPEIDALFNHERVVLTPHLGGFTKESVERATVAAVDNIVQYLG